VIIDDFHVVCFAFQPSKADTILIIDADAVLARSIRFEPLQPISGRCPQIFKHLSIIQHFELTHRDAAKIGWKAMAFAIPPKLFRPPSFESCNDGKWYRDAVRWSTGIFLSSSAGFNDGIR
jgi:hypothetical protein